MPDRSETALSQLTTLRVGGRARRLVELDRAEDIIEAVAAADAAAEAVLVIAGGSNLVIADEGFAGTVIRVLTRGVTTDTTDDGVRVTVAAGEPWDDLVARCVAEGLAGIECLSGIPGSTGATPIQNVGAYGQDVARTIASVRAYDRRAGIVVELGPADCEFAYRSSAIRRSGRHVVLAVTFALRRSPLGAPLRYAELARALDAQPGAQPSLAAVREAVIGLRAAKGMVIDPADPDSVSAGSFFVNPIISAEQFTALGRRVGEKLGAEVRPAAWPEADGTVKVSAAWLLEHAGFHRGYGQGRAGVSRKHSLAVVNRGGATADEIVARARELRDGVRTTFGVELRPEPTLIGIEL